MKTKTRPRLKVEVIGQLGYRHRRANRFGQELAGRGLVPAGGTVVGPHQDRRAERGRNGPGGPALATLGDPSGAAALHRHGALQPGPVPAALGRHAVVGVGARPHEGARPPAARPVGQRRRRERRKSLGRRAPAPLLGPHPPPQQQGRSSVESIEAHGG